MDQFKFILTDRLSNTTLALVTEPQGLGDAKEIWQLNKKYWGRFPQFTSTLKFAKEGASFIRNSFYRYGLNSYVTIQIKKLNNKGGISYFSILPGSVAVCILDFTTFQDGDYTVGINIKLYGFTNALSLNESTEYATPCYTPLAEGMQLYLPNDALCKMPYITLKKLFSFLADRITGGLVSSGEMNVKSDFLDNINASATEKIVLTTGRSVGYTTVATLSSIFLLTDNVAYVCGYNGCIMKSIDVNTGAAANWVPQSVPTPENLNCIIFDSNKIGHCVGKDRKSVV